MSFLEQYDLGERPVAAMVCLDLAIFHLGLVHEGLVFLIRSYPYEGIEASEAVNASSDLRVAERLLAMATGVQPPTWPWENQDFVDFWELGGNSEELRLMSAYMSRMDDFFRLFAQAQDMPTEYGQPLIDGIPQWRN